jgi:hypothetical protein
MTLKHLTLGLVSGISFSIISWMVGIIFNGMFSKTKFYKRFSDLNFVEGDVFNRIIGLNQFCWIIKNTFFKFLNQKIRIANRNTNLDDLKKEMTLAEISHLVGFLFVTVFSIYYSIKVSILYGATMMVPNIFLNLYPSLLQQKNKRRINRLIKN